MAQVGKPVPQNGVPHKKIELLWHRPESLFLKIVQDVRSNQ
ncbi:hypothetical protein QUB30_09735 [Microcoleus sp. BROC3]